MKKLYTITFSIILLIIVSYTVYSSLSNNNPHMFEGQCENCHLGLKNTDMLVYEPERLCTNCHKSQTNRSHPSDLYPKKNLPKIFPLFKGKMVCTSCHYAHPKFGQGKGKKDADTNPYFLRYEEAGKIFCFQCHKGDFSGGAKDSHALSMKKAHLASNIDSLDEIIDDNSRDCLSCHDGTLSSSANVRTEGANFEHSVGMSHPIGVSYENAYRKKPNEYRNINIIDNKIKLFDGKIGCETCHDHYSTEKHKLVINNYRSRLCLSCHDL